MLTQFLAQAQQLGLAKILVGVDDGAGKKDKAPAT
jgi:hypothetical protein